MAQVVGTISQFETLETLSPEIANSCDLGEIRFDLMGLAELNTLAPICQRIRSWSFPLLLTIRLQSEGGQWPDDRDQERFDLYVRGLDLVDMIDIELQSTMFPQLLALAAAKKKAVIVSYHNFTRTPDRSELQRLVSQIEAEVGSENMIIAKIATQIQRRQDYFVLMDLLEKSWRMPLCLIGMGPDGAGSRVLFPLLGSRLTYGYIDAVSAPGQLSCEELTHYLCRFDREYNAGKHGKPGMIPVVPKEPSITP